MEIESKIKRDIVKYSTSMMYNGFQYTLPSTCTYNTFRFDTMSIILHYITTPVGMIFESIMPTGAAGITSTFYA